MRVQLTARALLPLLLALPLLSAGGVRADQASGTWTGALEGRGNYYLERSTRVIVPAMKLDLTAPNGVYVGADYLVDVISSASIAQTGGEEDAVHTELRHGVGLNLGKELVLEGSQFDVAIRGTYSTEPDYTSLILGLDLAYTFNEKNTTLYLSGTRVRDDITSNVDPSFEEALTALALGAGFEQVLNPVMVWSASYQLGLLDGYLGNAYRTVLLGPLPHREAPPDERVRHTASTRLSWWIVPTDTAVHVILGGYVDDWGIQAITPELRVYQQIGNDFMIRPRYRFYAQTKADFQLDMYPADYEGPTTNDPKLTAFTTHTLGLSLEYRLSALRGGPLDFAQNTWLDIAVDRYWSTNTFGDGVIATAGGRIEF